MDEDTLEKLAVEEILKEAKRGAERAKELGSLGWQKSPVPTANKRFLRNMLVSTMRDSYRKESNTQDRKRKHPGDLVSRSHKSFTTYKRDRMSETTHNRARKSDENSHHNRHSDESKAKRKFDETTRNKLDENDKAYSSEESKGRQRGGETSQKLSKEKTKEKHHCEESRNQRKLQDYKATKNSTFSSENQLKNTERESKMRDKYNDVKHLEKELSDNSVQESKSSSKKHKHKSKHKHKKHKKSKVNSVS